MDMTFTLKGGNGEKTGGYVKCRLAREMLMKALT